MTHTDTATAVKNKRRSERVVLVVPIILSVKTADGRIASEVAKTQVVNAHGGLLSATLQVEADQEVVLTNPRTTATRRCRVIRTEQTSPQGWSIAFQFEEPAPNFWPISFPPSDWAKVEA
jgi:hypothetical protein